MAAKEPGKGGAAGRAPGRGGAPGMEQRDYSRYELSLQEWIQYTACGLGICAGVVYIFYRSLPLFLVLAPAAFFYPIYRRRELKAQRLYRLGLEFKETILILASFLSAGYSMENALSASVGELVPLFGPRSMMVEEMEGIVARIRMNGTVEDGFLSLGQRSGLEDVYNFAQVFAAAKRSGGDLVEIISHTAGVIRDKVQVQEEIHTMTAAKVFEQKIMSLIPFFIVLYIDLTSPGFFQKMYETMLGRMVMTGCLAVYGFSLVLSKKILEIPI